MLKRTRRAIATRPALHQSGAQAIAALAYGTDSVPKVDKIVGPGNIFVMLAKKQVYGVVDIEGLAGPSEVLIVADESTDPAACAADILAQAEHDALAQSVLVVTSNKVADAVVAEVTQPSCPSRTLGALCEVRSQMLTSPSPDPVAARRPSRDSAAAKTAPPCPRPPAGLRRR